MELTEEKKDTVRAIVALVEDPYLPARRSILDYVEELFDYTPEIKSFIEEELRLSQEKPCEACEWREQEIGHPSACPKHLIKAL